MTIIIHGRVFMKAEINISKKRLLKEVKKGFEFANDVTRIATLMQDVLALTLIQHERVRTKKTGIVTHSEMESLKNSLPIHYKCMTESQLRHMSACIDLYLEDLQDKSTMYQENQVDEPTLDEWQMVIVNQMIRQDKFEFTLANASVK